jgi:hypothetical protein
MVEILDDVLSGEYTLKFSRRNYAVIRIKHFFLACKIFTAERWPVLRRVLAE